LLEKDGTVVDDNETTTF